MFDWEELSQTVDKSEQGRPDRAGQPLEAAAEGQVSQLLLRSTREGTARLQRSGEVRGDHASLPLKVLTLHLALSHFQKARRALQVENPNLRNPLNVLRIITLASL